MDVSYATGWTRKVKAKFHYASWFGAGSKLVPSWLPTSFEPEPTGVEHGLIVLTVTLVADENAPNGNKSQIPLRYLVQTIFEPAPNQLRTNFKPDSVMEFGFYTSHARTAPPPQYKIQAKIMTQVRNGYPWHMARETGRRCVSDGSDRRIKARLHRVHNACSIAR